MRCDIHKMDISRHILSLSNILLLTLSVFLFYVWFILLFTSETLIDPGNLPESKMLRYQSLTFGYSSSILAFLSTIPLIISIVVNWRYTKSIFVSKLNKIFIGFIVLGTLLAIIQFLAVFTFGEVYT